jgi:hypothetical protein
MPTTKQCKCTEIHTIHFSSSIRTQMEQQGKTPLASNKTPSKTKNQPKIKTALPTKKQECKKKIQTSLQKDHKLSQALHHVKLKCLTNFGFCSNPDYTKQRNFNNTAKEDISSLFLQPKNLAFHNLCSENNLPLGTKQLLGLNLKFCLATNNLKNNISDTTRKMAQSIRTTFYLRANRCATNDEYEKQIYVKLKNWNPPTAPIEIEEKITVFEKELKKKHQQLLLNNKHRNLLNLTPLQKNIKKLLRDNRDIVIKPTDKNLGPAAMDSKSYIKQVLEEHLLTNSYKQLSKEEAKTKIKDLKTQLNAIINNNRDKLTTSELNYFQQSLQSFLRLPVFYGLPKVHQTPMSLRLVVSTCGGLLALFSNWLDFCMKELLPLVKSHLKHLATLIADLKKLKTTQQIPNNALLFMADAKSMYTNIDKDTGLTSISRFINDNKFTGRRY